MDDTDTHQEIKFQQKKKKKTHKNVESGQSFSCAIAVFAMHLKPLKLRQLCLISTSFHHFASVHVFFDCIQRRILRIRHVLIALKFLKDHIRTGFLVLWTKTSLNASSVIFRNIKSPIWSTNSSWFWTTHWSSSASVKSWLLLIIILSITEFECKLL